MTAHGKIYSYHCGQIRRLAGGNNTKGNIGWTPPRLIGITTLKHLSTRGPSSSQQNTLIPEKSCPLEKLSSRQRFFLNHNFISYPIIAPFPLFSFVTVPKVVGIEKS